jgi:hypothetical protein
MRRFAVVFAFASVVFLDPSAALAQPPLTPAERFCLTQEGDDFEEGLVAGAIYTCFNHEGPSFSSTQLATAERLCENVYGGTFVPFARHYRCAPPS